MSDTRVSAVIFDYGNVLSLSPTSQDWDRMASAFGLSLDIFQKHYWDFRDEYDRGDVDGVGYWKKMAKSAGRQLNNDEAQKFIAWDNEQWTRPNPDMLEFSRLQQNSGKKIAILSNMQAEMLAHMRRKFDWLYSFDLQIYSCEIGMTKPDPKIYLLCCEQLGSKPEETLFLDDKSRNVEGAKLAGLQALVFDGDRSAPENYLKSLG